MYLVFSIIVIGSSGIQFRGTRPVIGYMLCEPCASKTSPYAKALNENEREFDARPIPDIQQQKN